MYSKEELKEIEEILIQAAIMAANKMGKEFTLVYHYSVENLKG